MIRDLIHGNKDDESDDEEVEGMGQTTELDKDLDRLAENKPQIIEED